MVEGEGNGVETVRLGSQCGPHRTTRQRIKAGVVTLEAQVRVRSVSEKTQGKTFQGIRREGRYYPGRGPG